MHFGHAIDREWTAKLLDRFLKTKERRVWLALEDSEIAGFIEVDLLPTYKYRGREGRIGLLYVRDRFREKGIGSGLLDAVMKFSDKNGIKTVKVETGLKNKQAQDLYKGFGLTDEYLLLMRDIEHRKKVKSL